MEEDIYFPYSKWLFERFGEKVYKLPVNLPVTCPNRLNGSDGCTFCSELGTGFEASDQTISITEQLEKACQIVSKKYKAKKFIAYFQNYTNTFMPLEELKGYIEEAISFPDIVEVSISTRPDCINDEYLEMLKDEIINKGIQVNIELGLQTVNYHSLIKVNRGHTLAEYIDAVLRIKRYPITICTHVIGNLPYDDNFDIIETAKILSVLNTDIVKVHSLYIAKETRMADDYANGLFEICSKEEYYNKLRLFLEYLSPDIAVERLFSRIPEKDSVFSNWGTSWWRLKEEFEQLMVGLNSYQGKYCQYMNGAALKGVFR